MNKEAEQILNIRVNYTDAINAIGAYKGKINELKEAQNELKKSLRNGEITNEEYIKSVTAIEEETKAYKTATRELSKEIQNNIKSQKEKEGSLRQLRAELSNATKQYDELSKAEREGAKGQGLKKHINEITDALKGAEEDTQRFYRNVGNYENAIKNTLGLNNSFANSIMNITANGGGFKSMLSEASVSIKAFGNTLLGMMANPAFIALAGIAGAGVVFKWFYDYNEGLIKATNLTREFLGLTGDALVSVRSEIQATADTYGKDYKEVLEAVDALTSQYGINTAKAIEIINKGFQSGADLNGDMIAQIKEYGPSFHDAGIEASALVAIIQQTRSGIFSDAGMKDIQMAQKRLTEMSAATAKSLDSIGISSKKVTEDLANGTRTTFDVIQEISAKMGTLNGNSTEVGAVMRDVFGKQGAAGGRELVKALKDVSTNLDEVKKQTGEHGALLDEQRAIQAELNKTTAALFDMSQKGWEEMTMGAKNFGTKALVSVAKGVVSIINYFIELYNNSMAFRYMISAIVLQFKQAWTVAKALFELVVNGFKSSGRSLKAFATILEGILTFSFEKVQKGFSELTSNMGTTFKEQWGTIKNAFKEGTDNAIDAVNDTIKGRKIEKITIPTEIEEGKEDTATTIKSQGAKGIKTDGKDKKKEKDNAQAIAKKEAEEIRKAEDLLMQIVEQSDENMRKAIGIQYDRQIEDIKKRLQTEKNLTVKTKQALNKQIETLEQIKAKKLSEFDAKVRAEEISREQKYIELRLAVVAKGSKERLDLELKRLDNERQLEIDAVKNSVANEEYKQQQIQAIIEKYDKIKQEATQNNGKENIELQTEEIKKRYETKIAETKTEISPDNELEALRLKMEMQKEIMDNARQEEGESEEAFNARRLQASEEYLRAKEEFTNKEIEMEKTKAALITSVMGGIADVAEALGDKNKDMAKLAKIVALGEIAVNTGVALSAGIKQAQSVPYPANLVAIATTVAAILGNVAAAIKTVKSAKFAHGGLVTGEGTDTSDSIDARLSNGESVLTARATRMFAPVLSVFNQIGGGVPISVTSGSGSQALGEEFLANAVAKGMTMAPRPVVSVEEIDRVAHRVRVIENIANIG